MNNDSKELQKFLGEIQRGERFYINSINLTVDAIEELRKMIKTGIVTPVREEVEKAYKDVISVMNGDVIFPQMDYVKM